jgi:hypothetical protein
VNTGFFQGLCVDPVNFGLFPDYQFILHAHLCQGREDWINPKNRANSLKTKMDNNQGEKEKKTSTAFRHALSGGIACSWSTLASRVFQEGYNGVIPGAKRTLYYHY